MKNIVIPSELVYGQKWIEFTYSPMCKATCIWIGVVHAEICKGVNPHIRLAVFENDSKTGVSIYLPNGQRIYLIQDGKSFEAHYEALEKICTLLEKANPNLKFRLPKEALYVMRDLLGIEDEEVTFYSAL